MDDANEDFKAGWDDDSTDNPAAELIGVEPTKGLSRQTREWERNEAEAAKPAKPVAPINNNPGKDDEFTAEWKKSHADDQREDGVKKLMKLRNLTRDHAEKMIPHVR